eukprot:CAMPEP_0113540796 /NCGR_PEP_ID=MMETSP0015_2-20120614/8676_1 /TAXON_ID=2838 /ORGANISM="Odontella" /LENGTH=916 /DNA_ID=CAMNT_0000440633 /DNA_START=68 /DNA_END=2818 /DNA_ORIENTATION=+ /assembly_acc=CAM_ASM_000160
MGDFQQQLSGFGTNGTPQQAPPTGLMRKVRSLDCFHRRIGGAPGLPSPRSSRRRLTLSKTPEDGVFDGGKDACCLEGGGGGGGDERESPRRSSCDASGATAASRFSLAANRRFYHAAAKSASSGSLADLASESHGLSSSLPIEDDETDVTAMLTAPGMGGFLPGGSARARLFNVAVLALLGLAAASDLARRGVVTASRIDWGVESSSQFYYDDLSTEGIVPPSRFGPPYRSESSGLGGGRSKLGLGSAMIGSVTNVLGPILPFAGGMDLRRGEAWGLDNDGQAATGWIRGALDAMWEYKEASWGSWSSTSSVSPASPSDGVAQMPRGGAAGNARSNGGRKSKGAKASVHREATLSAAEPFLPTDAIADLDLGDMTAVFRYAVESGRDGFDRTMFLKRGGGEERGQPVSEPLKRALDAVDVATAKSRGVGVEPAKTTAVAETYKDGIHRSGPLSPEAGFGDVDALQFCAAMRLFAEWRIIRQVPDGYKGYAVGMGLGHKDVVQNVVKIESAVHDLLQIQSEEMEMQDEASCNEKLNESDGKAQACFVGADQSQSGPPRSPTLRALLRYEVDHRVQTSAKLPRLKEKSAAMGLLWVRRQLQYQTVIFSNMLKVGSVFPSAIDAVRSAYSEVYDKFHGWAVQKIFNYSFQAAPEAEVIYKHMNPTRLLEVMAQARRGQVEHVGEIRYESTETTESETVAVASGEGVEERIVSEDTTVTRKTIIEESWDDESASSATEEKFHTHGSAKAQSVAEQSPDDITSNETEATPASNNTKDKDDNPWVKFGGHVVSEWDKLANHVGGEWDKVVNHVGGECDKIGKHIGGEWDKLASNVVRIFHKDDEDKNARGSSRSSTTDMRGGALSGSGGAGLTGEELERYVSGEMARDAHGHIERYLRIVRPLLTDLAGLFDEMNMDDPTKV